MLSLYATHTRKNGEKIDNFFGNSAASRLHLAFVEVQLARWRAKIRWNCWFCGRASANVVFQKWRTTVYGVLVRTEQKWFRSATDAIRFDLS